MHAGLENRFAVQRAPQADRAEMIARRERAVGEVAGDFFGREVDVGEDHHLAGRLLHDLRAPTGVDAGVEAFAAGDAERFHQLDEAGEILAAAAVGVVIVVAPAEAERVLAGTLQAAGAVASHPVVALGAEEDLAGAVDAKVGAWRRRRVRVRGRNRRPRGRSGAGGSRRLLRGAGWRRLRLATDRAA